MLNKTILMTLAVFLVFAGTALAGGGKGNLSDGRWRGKGNPCGSCFNEKRRRFRGGKAYYRRHNLERPCQLD